MRITLRPYQIKAVNEKRSGPHRMSFYASNGGIRDCVFSRAINAGAYSSAEKRLNNYVL